MILSKGILQSSQHAHLPKLCTILNGRMETSRWADSTLASIWIQIKDGKVHLHEKRNKWIIIFTLAKILVVLVIMYADNQNEIPFIFLYHPINLFNYSHMAPTSTVYCLLFNLLWNCSAETKSPLDNVRHGLKICMEQKVKMTLLKSKIQLTSLRWLSYSLPLTELT